MIAFKVMSVDCKILTDIKKKARQTFIIVAFTLQLFICYLTGFYNIKSKSKLEQLDYLFDLITVEFFVFIIKVILMLKKLLCFLFIVSNKI